MAIDRLAARPAALGPPGAGGPCVLVTGGAGYVGSHAVLELLDSGFRAVVLDNLVTGFRWAVDSRAAFVDGCVEDDTLVRRLLRDHDVRGVLHFAGSTIAPESVRDPLKYYRNNTAASRLLLESAVAERVRHFVFSSTAAVYGPSGLSPVSEDSPPQPATPYGRSKLITERPAGRLGWELPVQLLRAAVFQRRWGGPPGAERGRRASARLDSSRLLWKWRSGSDRK